MLLSVEELIKLLRSSVNVQLPDSEDVDPAFLTMTDEDLLLFIKVGVSRAYPDVDRLEELPEGSEFAVLLLAKIELYLKLAVLTSPKVDLGADNNNYLKLDQRFKHYMELAGEARKQYEDWLEKESGSGTLNTYDVLLSSRHLSNRNYQKQVTPKVRIIVDSVTMDSIEFHWKLFTYSHFGRFKVYMSDSPIMNMYADGMTYNSKLNYGAKLIKSTDNIRDVYHSIKGLKPETTYYVAVIEIEKNQVFGYSEVSFTTLGELQEEENISKDDFSDDEEKVEDNVDDVVEDENSEENTGEDLMEEIEGILNDTEKLNKSEDDLEDGSN